MATTARKTSILWVIKGLAAGGAERLLADAARLRSRDEFDVRLAYLLDARSDMVQAIQDTGVEVVCLGAGGAMDLRWLVRLRSEIRDHRPDVVHVHSPMVAALLRPIIAAMGPKERPFIVTTEHNVWDSYHPLTRWADRLTLRLDDTTLAVSAEVRASMDRRSAARVEVLVHGVDVAALGQLRETRASVRSRLGVADDEILVVTVANLRENKDYPNLLRAAAHASAAGLPMRFLSIGQGPLLEELERERDALGLDQVLTFHGFHSDPPSLVAGADMFCLASRYEGLPIAMLEAMAIGVPIVATSVGGIPSVVSDGVHGRLVGPGDSAALGDALISMADTQVRSNMAEAALVRAQNFDIRAAVRRQEEIYASLASSRIERPAD